MKKSVIAMLLVVSSYAQAQTSATVTAASNYIWRGISFSSLGREAAQGAPVIQGSFDYAHSSGFGLGLFVGGSDTTNFDIGAPAGTAERDNEFDPTISYTYAFADDFKIVAAVTGLLYVKNSSNNSVDYQLSVVWRAFRLDGSYMDNYFGTKSSDTYIRLSLREPLNDKVGLILAVGNSSFNGDENIRGFKESYVDYRAGFSYTVENTSVEVAYSATNRQDLFDKELNDKAATLAVSMTFQ